MKKLEGTEKQIKWANDLLAEISWIMEDLRESIINSNSKEEKKSRELKKVDGIDKMINNYTDAGDIIDNFQYIKKHKNQKEKNEIAYMFFRVLEEKENIKFALKYVNRIIDKYSEF